MVVDDEKEIIIIVREIGADGIEKLITNLKSHATDFNITTKLYRLLSILKKSDRFNTT